MKGGAVMPQERKEIKIAKIILAIIGILGCIFIIYGLCFAPKALSAEWKWQHFGADPYAKTRAEAMRTREFAFSAMGLPDQVIAKLIRVTVEPGEKIRIVNGDKFSAMISKKGVVHQDVVVAFVKPPISGKMEYTAPAEKWQVSLEGRIYTVILPEICNNWSFNWTFAPPPPPLPEKCVELSFNAPVGGKVRWGIASDHGPLLPSACNAQKQNEGPWTAWTGQCDDCVGAIDYIRGVIGEKAEIYHKYLYSVTAKRQTLRFSTAIWADLVYICLEYKDGKMTCGVYMRPQDWKGQYSAFIQDTFWISDENCPK